MRRTLNPGVSLSGLLAAVLIKCYSPVFGQSIGLTQISTGPQLQNRAIFGFSPDGAFVCISFAEPGGADGLRCTTSTSTVAAVPVHNTLAQGDFINKVSYSAGSDYIYYLAPGFGERELYRASLQDLGAFEKVSRSGTTPSERIEGFTITSNRAVVEWAQGPTPGIEVIDVDVPGSDYSISDAVNFVFVGLATSLNASGDRIVFRGFPDGASTTALFAVNTDGTQFTQLTFPGAEVGPSYVSAEYERVLYLASGTGAGEDVYSVPGTGGGSTRLSTDSQSDMMDAVHLSDSETNVCYLERFNSDEYWASCGPISNPEMITSFGYVTDEDDNSSSGTAAGRFSVFGESLVALTEKNGQRNLVVLPMDGQGALQEWGEDVTTYHTVEELGAIVYRQFVGGPNPYRWYFRELSDTTPRLLFAESDMASAGFIGYAMPTDRLLFTRDIDPSAVTEQQVYSMNSDGTDARYITDSFFSSGLVFSVRPVLSADQSQLIYAHRQFTLLGVLSTRVRAISPLGGTAINLLTRTDPEGESPRRIDRMIVSPTDPYGTLILAQSETGTTDYDYWITYTKPALLYANGFESP